MKDPTEEQLELPLDELFRRTEQLLFDFDEEPDEEQTYEQVLYELMQQ